jgi:hypothetical protein
VGAEDRQGAKDAYFAHIAAFNGKIQELARQHERDAEQVCFIALGLCLFTSFL